MIVAGGDDIPNTNGALEQNDEPADEIGNDFLQAKTDAHTQGGNQPLRL